MKDPGRQVPTVCLRKEEPGWLESEDEDVRVRDFTLLTSSQMSLFLWQG